MTRRAPRPHNLGTMTKAQVMGRIRSCLRRHLFRYDWLPKKRALEVARRTARSARAKWEYKCAHCRKWWLRREVEVDHIEPCGSMRDYAEIPWWIENYLCEEVEGFQVLCKSCHRKKTARERERRKRAS